MIVPTDSLLPKKMTSDFQNVSLKKDDTCSFFGGSMRQLGRAVMLFIVVLGLVVPGCAQTPTGTIQGNVLDSTGAAVSGAMVRIKSAGTNSVKALKTDAAGRYELPLIQPGSYIVMVDAPGFRPERQENIQVQVAQTRAVNFTLTVGQITENVQVDSSAAALDTYASTVNTVFSSKPISELPLNGRNPFDLVELVPGVSTVDASGGPGNGGTTPHIAGGRNSTSEEQIDGLTNIIPENNAGNSFSAYQPVVDSVQEFSVQTSVLPAEFGRFFGGVINVVTKSGSNQLHGTLFEFARNSVLDAKDYFSIGPKPAVSRNQFGGTVGGPIVIPHIYNGRDKSFFFFAVEDSRENDSATETDSVPLPAWRNGDFSSLNVPIYDPTTAQPNSNGGYARTAFAGNQIPLSRFDPVAIASLKFYPMPNTGPAGAQFNNYVVTGVTTADYIHYDLRVDQDIRKNWHTFARYSHLQVNDGALNDYNNVAALQGGGNSAAISVHSFSLDNLLTFSSTFLGEFRYGFSRLVETSTPFGEGFNPSALGFSSSYSSVATTNASVFPTFNVSNGFSGLGPVNGYAILLEAPSVHQASASFIKIAGSHTIKMGGEFRKLFLNFHQYGFPSGQFSFDQSWTQQTLSSADGSGNPFASMLLGLPTSGQITHDTTSAETSEYYALYVQDDYRATPKLTFNVGLRWDVEVPRTDRFNRLSYWDSSLPSPLQGQVQSSACLYCSNLVGQMIFTGTPQSKFGRAQGPIQWKDYAPRAGFSFSATSKTVVRGGFGLVFGASGMQVAGTSGGSGNDGFSSSTPFNFSFNNQQSIFTKLDNPAPNGFNLPQGAAGGPSTFLGNGISDTFFSSYRNPYSMQTNLTVQEALPRGVILEVGYLGNRGLFLLDGDPGVPFSQVNPSYLSLGQHLYDSVANPFYGLITTPGSPQSQPTIQRNYLLRPFPQYNGVESYRKPTASSDYNAVTVKLNKSFSHGFSVLVAYTGSKTMDNGASSVTFLGQASATYINQYNPAGEYGLSAEDQSRVLVGDFLYELPFGRGQRFLHDTNGFANLLINGWQAGGIVSWNSGNPIVLSAAIEQTGLFTLGQRPTEALGNANISHKTKDHWFNTALFSQPAPFTLGNAPRALPNAHVPGTTNADLSAIKNNYIGDSKRYSVQLRGEFFNAFNHPQFAPPDTGVNDGNFGKITSTNANSSRQVQLALKFIY
jgi:hypothetical protein